ncbi:MAG: hypothetical protein ACYTDU_13960 [Planctomycetota bacterium]
MIAISSGTVAAVVIGVFAGVLLRKRLNRFVQREGRRHAYLVVGLIALTGLLYSAVHEYGHKSVAQLLGGEVRSVSWTVLSGEPHVVYGHMPEGARPWAAAGGVFVPILLAFVLVAARVAFGRWLPRWANTTLSVPAAVILLASCGTVIPIFTGRGHMAALASHYRLGEAGRVLLQLVPVLFSVAGLMALRYGTRLAVAEPASAANEGR